MLSSAILKRLFFAGFCGVVFLSALLPSCWAVSVPLQPVNSVDFEGYSGWWYEVALIPNRFQKHCVTDAKVNYQPLSPGVYRDYFECRRANGKLSTMVGRAKVLDSNKPGVLSATFFNFLGWRYWFGENYWIIDLAPDYRYALVGHPSRKYAWVLAREPKLSQQDWVSLARQIKAQHYNPCDLKISPQSQGHTQQRSLCEMIGDTALP